MVILDWASETDGQDFNIEVFGSWESAKEAFDKEVEQEKEYDELMNSSLCQIEETDSQFEVWEDGSYCTNHFRISIIERRVKE